MLHRWRIALPVLLILAVIALMAAACDGDDDETPSGPATGEPFVVGFNGGLSHPTITAGRAVLDGLTGYIERLNANGGIDGHPVEIEARDDGALEAERATTNFIEFRDSIEPSVVVGFTVSNVVDAIVPLAEESEIPIIAVGVTDALLDSAWGYGIDSQFKQDVAFEWDYVKQLAESDSPSTAIFGADSAAGRDLIATGEELIEAEGELALTELLPVPQPDDMSAAASRVVDSEADFVIGGIYGTIPVLLQRSLDQLGWEGAIVNFHGGSSPALIEQVNDPDYYVVRSYKFPSDTSAGVQEMVEAVSDAGGDPNAEFTPQGWAIGAVVEAALSECGFPCSAQDMKAALDGLGEIGDVNGVAEGPIGYTEDDHNGVKWARIYHFVDGNIEAVSDPIKAGE